MLCRLYIQNFTIIPELEIELSDGLNIFTGKTGAGKSLIVGAIEVLLGLKSFSEVVLSGSRSAVVSGSFYIRDSFVLNSIRELTGLELEEGELVITRRLNPSGRVMTTVNSISVAGNLLKQIAELLVDIHSQRDNQFLLRPRNQLFLLDRFASCQDLAEEFADCTRRLRKLVERREELAEKSRYIADQLDLYNFQLNEIESARLSKDEYEELKSCFERMSNIESLRKDTQLILELLDGYGENPSIMELLSRVYRIAVSLASVDATLKGIVDEIDSAIAGLSDVSQSLNSYLEKLEFDPEEYERIDKRLALIERLIQKYGAGSFDKLLEYSKELKRKIKELSGEDNDIEHIDKKIRELRSKRDKLGESLSAKRKAASKKLIEAINKELWDLAMGDVLFDIEFRDTEDLSSLGFEEIEFMVRTNPGQPYLPLRKVASGGELNRITLAIESVLASADRVSLMIFDEIDANIGGRIGEVIGRKLRELSHTKQIICITHLPQIACFADKHFVVEKRSEGDETISSVVAVEGRERIKELAEMISGRNITATTIKQAEEMLRRAQFETDMDFKVAG